MSGRPLRSGSSAEQKEEENISALRELIVLQQQQMELQQQRLELQQQQMKENQEQNARLIKELIENNKNTAALQGAKTLAGSVPRFDGTINNIAVHKWALSMESWFTSAMINEEQEKINYVSMALGESAKQWYTSEVEAAADRQPYKNWKDMKEAMMKKFLALEPEEWARQQLSWLTNKKESNKNIIVYNNQYMEFNQFVKQRDERDRLSVYLNGLPTHYERILKHKQVATLKEAMTQASTRYNIDNTTAATPSASGRTTPSVNQMEEEDMEIESTTSSSSSSQPAPTSDINSMKEQLVQISNVIGQMQKQWQSRRGGFGNFRGRGGYRGRGNYRGRGGFNRNSSRSPSPGRYWQSLGIEEDAIEDRKNRGACMKCGKEGHYISECRGQLNTSKE